MPNTALELRERRAKAWDAAKAFLESKRGPDGIMSAEDSAVYDKMEADIVNLGKEIDRADRQNAIEAELNRNLRDPITNTPGAGTNSDKGGKKTGRASDDYRTAFWNAMRGQPAVNDFLQIGSDPDGGYLAPDEFERQIIQGLEELNVFRTLARVIRTSSGDRKIPIASQGITASWVEEGQAIPETDAKFSQITLSAYKLAALVKASVELLNDSAFDIQAYLAADFARAFAQQEEDAFINGDGVGKPTGILADAPVGVTANSPTALTADELIGLVYSLKAPYRSRSVYLMNDATVGAIRKLKDANGQYLWQPALTAGTPDMIIGRPLYTSAFMPVIAPDAVTVLFGDLSYYWIADRTTRNFQRLNELFATTGLVGFIGYQRVDGKLILPEAVKTIKQGETK